MAKESIEIVKDMMIEYEDWMETSVDNVWTIRTLKIWFSLLGEQSPWAQWPAITDDADFMKHACEIIETEMSDLHGYLTNKSAQFKFDDL